MRRRERLSQSAILTLSFPLSAFRMYPYVCPYMRPDMCAYIFVRTQGLMLNMCTQGLMLNMYLMFMYVGVCARPYMCAHRGAMLIG